LKFRSKVIFENIFQFLGYDFLYPVNTIFVLKPIVKKLLSIEIVIFHKYQSQEVASNKFEKGPLRDYETAFCSLLALMVLEKKIFKD
jgi:hypothetical protein